MTSPAQKHEPGSGAPVHGDQRGLAVLARRVFLRGIRRGEQHRVRRVRLFRERRVDLVELRVNSNLLRFARLRLRRDLRAQGFVRRRSAGGFRGDVRAQLRRERFVRSRSAGGFRGDLRAQFVRRARPRLRLISAERRRARAQRQLPLRALRLAQRALFLDDDARAHRERLLVAERLGELRRVRRDVERERGNARRLIVAPGRSLHDVRFRAERPRGENRPRARRRRARAEEADAQRSLESLNQRQHARQGLRFFRVGVDRRRGREGVRIDEDRHFFSVPA